MGNVKNKNREIRKSRRHRYIDAIDPLRRLYNCTAAQVYNYVSNDLTSLNKSIQENKKISEETQQLKIEIAILQTSKEKMERQIEVLHDDLSMNIETSTRFQETQKKIFDKLVKERDTLASENTALKERIERQDRQIEQMNKKLDEDLLKKLGI